MGSLGSVDNALRILLMLRDNRGVRVSQVADDLGVARSTAHRLLTTLHKRGFVVQDAHKVYWPGPVFAEGGFARTTAGDVASTLHPLVVELTERTGETSHLALLEGNGVRFIDCAESPNLLRVGTRTGMLLPAHSNSAGKVLLAELLPADFTALYPRGIAGPIGTAKSRRSDLLRQFAGIRRRGYASNFDESAQGVTALGAPLRDDAGHVVAALAVAAPSTRCPKGRVAELADVLLEVAARAPAVIADARQAGGS